MSLIENLLNQVLQYLSVGAPAKAENALKKILKLDSKNVDANHLIAILYKDQGQYGLSLKFFERALNIDPTFSKIWFNKGLLHQELGEWESAIFHYEKAASLDLTSNDAWLNLGNLLMKMSRYLEAFTSYQKATSIEPADFEAWSYCGSALHKLRQYENALQAYKKAIGINPQYYLAWANQAITLSALSEFEQALQSYEMAITLKQDDPLLWSNRGLVLHDLNRYEEALESHQKGILLDEKNHEVWSNRGITLHALQRYEDALDSYRRALKIKPDYHPAWSNLGVTLNDLNRYEEAIGAYEEALAIEPNFDDARWNLGIAQLTLGDYINGFKNYEYRWKTAKSITQRYSSVERLVRPNDAIGKTLLVWHEQGHGDTIQFCRYVKKLVSIGIKVILEVQLPLRELIENAFPECMVVADGKQIPNIDYQIPVLSLPTIFTKEKNDFFLPIPYLQPSIEKSLLWKKKLNLKDKKINIGLAISGNPKQGNDKNRSIGISFFEPLLNQANLFLIQKEIRVTDKDFLKSHPEIKYLGDEISTFDDSAAIVDQMDLIITVCTSLAHLSGALGKSTFIILPWCPDWRWLLNCSDSPWYPSVKLFRQPTFGDWNPVISEVILELNKR
mgnify:CR=1 FL=1